MNSSFLLLSTISWIILFGCGVKNPPRIESDPTVERYVKDITGEGALKEEEKKEILKKKSKKPSP